MTSGNFFQCLFIVRLEIAELSGHRDMKKSFLPQPLIAAPDGSGDGETHHLELINLDLQVHASFKVFP